jgi:Zn-dependent protease
MDQGIFIIFELIVLIFSVMVHEISHGAVALALGDETAKRAGRLTLNPLKHIDPFGSVILPLVLALPLLFGGTPLIFGWAKPVPYNPHYLKNPKLYAGIIGAVGPLSNFLVAFLFAIGIRVVLAYGGDGSLALLFNAIVQMNIVLGVFNLVPIPPLDGSNVLFAFLPERFAAFREFLIRYGFALLLGFLFFGYQLITPTIEFIYRFFVGV